MTMMAEDVTRKLTTAATAIPAGVRGRQSTAQNIASPRYHRVLTPLSAISIGALDSKITPQASSTRRATDRICPALA